MRYIKQSVTFDDDAGGDAHSYFHYEVGDGSGVPMHQCWLFPGFHEEAARPLDSSLNNEMMLATDMVAMSFMKQFSCLNNQNFNQSNRLTCKLTRHVLFDSVEWSMCNTSRSKLVGEPDFWVGCLAFSLQLCFSFFGDSLFSKLYTWVQLNPLNFK